MTRKEYPFTHHQERQMYDILLAGRSMDTTKNQRQLAQCVTETLTHKVYPVVEIQARKYYTRLVRCGLGGPNEAVVIVNAGINGAVLAITKWYSARSYKFSDFASSFIRREIVGVYQRIRGF